MTSFSKTGYWVPLVPNAKSVDNKTNTYFKNPRVPPVAENEAEFVLVKHVFQYDSALCSQKLTKISRSPRVKYSNVPDQGNQMWMRLQALKDL